jgi:hypothetical protein
MSKKFERLTGRFEAVLLGVVAILIALAWLVSRLTGG